MSITKCTVGILLIVSFLLPQRAFAVAFSDIYVFGDSLSDTGNVFSITAAIGQPPIPGAPYFQGRFSNGPNYAEVLASNLGHGPVVPSVLLGGNNYAAGGARSSSHFLDPALPALGFPATASLGVAGQVQMFLGDVGGNADPNALYIVWGGSNDIQDALLDSNPLAFVQTASQNLFDAISALAGAGAEHVLIPNVPDVGLTPRATLAGVSGAATALSQALNANLDALLAGLAGVDLIRFDVFSLLQDIAANPAAFGFTDATTSCYTGPITGGPPAPCANPEALLFWDDFHPTAAAHEILAARITSAVIPEPGTWVLLATGVLGFLGYGWYRRVGRRH